MNQFWETIVTVTGGLVAVAIVALLVSRKSQTPAVLQAAASGYANNLGVAESPVTGAHYSINTSYPGQSVFGPTINNSFGF